MAMEIYDELNRMLRHYFLNFVLNVENLRMLRFLLSLPVAIQIITDCIATVIA